MSQKQSTKPAPQEKTETKTKDAKDLKNEDLEADMDQLIADIDEVLEENAQEFVQNYVQRGGE